MPKVKKVSTNKFEAESVAENSQAKNDEHSFSEFENFISQKPKPKSNGYIRSRVISVLLFFIIIITAVFVYNWYFNDVSKERQFKAIYLENDQLYYAKVVREDKLNIYLDEVYYIQMQEQLMPVDEEGLETETVSVPVLLRRGGELHQPVGWMQVNRSKVIAIEEIGADSEILKEINRQKSQ